MKKYLDFVSLVRTNLERDRFNFYQFIFLTVLTPLTTGFCPPGHWGFVHPNSFFQLFNPLSTRDIKKLKEWPNSKRQKLFLAHKFLCTGNYFRISKLPLTFSKPLRDGYGRPVDRIGRLSWAGQVAWFFIQGPRIFFTKHKHRSSFTSASSDPFATEL